MHFIPLSQKTLNLSVKVKKTGTLEIREIRFLHSLYMSCRLDLCNFYVGDAIISRIISHLKFPPLSEKLSPKCKQMQVEMRLGLVG